MRQSHFWGPGLFHGEGDSGAEGAADEPTNHDARRQEEGVCALPRVSHRVRWVRSSHNNGRHDFS